MRSPFFLTRRFFSIPQPAKRDFSPLVSGSRFACAPWAVLSASLVLLTACGDNKTSSGDADASSVEDAAKKMDARVAQTCEESSDCTENTNTYCSEGRCVAKLANGESCSEEERGAVACRSGFCTDDVCCDAACAGDCEACSSAGVCAPIAAGEDPDNECEPESDDCGRTGHCNGSSACQLAASGTTCSTESCAGGGNGTCDGSGICMGGAGDCNPFVCDTSRNACRSTCSDNAHCAGNHYCDGTTCLPQKTDGDTCLQGHECQNDNCVDGRCCNEACAGTCRSCLAANTNQADGVCGNILPSVGAQSECTVGDVNCQSGLCDGAGACQNAARGTTCADASCSSSMLTAARTCNNAGTCQDATSPTACAANFQCEDGSACRSTCSDNAHCASGFSCQSNACAPITKANGDTCLAGSECTSTICADGVCCDAACAGDCEACDLSGSGGTCSAIAVGTDPSDECADETGTDACGQTGACDGARACQVAAADVTCAEASCSSSMLTAARTCDGAGTCEDAVSPTACASNFQCEDGSACRSTCDDNTHCADGFVCDSSNDCVAVKANGETCSAGSECTSTFCEDSVCCDAACAGLCEACSSAGACEAIAVNTDPGDECADESGSDACGQTGACDGARACQVAAADVTCAEASCSSSMLTAARTCDGAGTCEDAASPLACASNFQCEDGSACRSTCTDNAHCASGFFCNSTTNACIAVKVNGEACDVGSECASTFCADDVCCDAACDRVCEACSSAGACEAIAVNTDPGDECVDETGTNACGQTGDCDGARACRVAASGMSCGEEASCSSSMLISARTCDGAGTCPAAVSTACAGNFQCNADDITCRSMCTDDTHCASGACVGGACPDSDGDGAVDSSDVDDDGDGLIEIRNLDMLNHVRYNRDGTGYTSSEGGTAVTTGCGGASGVTACTGYELVGDLDFALDASYASGSTNMVEWRPTDGNPETATNAGWPPIENISSDDFIFEGNHFVIKNLYVRLSSAEAETVNAGLFRSFGDGLFRNLGVTQAYVFASSSAESVNAGSLMGLQSGGALVNCHATGFVSASNSSTNTGHFARAGGLLGYQRDAGHIAHSFATTSVSAFVTGGGEAVAGGLVAVLEGTLFRNNYATGLVSAHSSGHHATAGGLVADTGSTIRSSYATGSVLAVTDSTTHKAYAGGVLGFSAPAGFFTNYATGAVSAVANSANSAYAGGLIGFDEFDEEDFFTSYWDRDTAVLQESNDRGTTVVSHSDGLGQNGGGLGVGGSSFFIALTSDQMRAITGTHPNRLNIDNAAFVLGSASEYPLLVYGGIAFEEDYCETIVSNDIALREGGDLVDCGDSIPGQVLHMASGFLRFSNTTIGTAAGEPFFYQTDSGEDTIVISGTGVNGTTATYAIEDAAGSTLSAPTISGTTISGIDALSDDTVFYLSVTITNGTDTFVKRIRMKK